MGEEDTSINCFGGWDEERDQPYARTLWNKIEAKVKEGEKLQNHEVLEVLNQILEKPEIRKEAEKVEIHDT